MPAGELTAFHLGSDFTALGGTDLGVLLPSQWSLVERVEDFQVTSELTVTLPLDTELYDSIDCGLAIKGFFRDASTSPPTVDWAEWRILTIDEDERSGQMILTCAGWLHQLGDGREVVYHQPVVPTEEWSFTVDSSLTPAGHVADSLTNYSNYNAFILPGTISPTAVVRVVGTFQTVRARLVAMCEAIYADTGVKYQVSARRNGTTQILIDVTVYGGATTVDVRSRKNLIGFRRRRTRLEQAKFVQFSEPDALKRPTYVVSVVSAGAYIEVQNMVTGQPGPAIAADQWNTNRSIIEWKNGTEHDITDTVVVDALTTRFHMASTATLVAGDLVYIATGGGQDLKYVTATDIVNVNQPLRTLAGSDPLTNLAGVNADMHDWTGADPTGWTHAGTVAPVKTATAGYTRYGGWSAQGKLGGANPHILSPSMVIQLAANEWFLYVVYFRADAVGVGDLFRFRNPQSGASDDILITSAVATAGQYAAIAKAYQMSSSGAKTCQCRLVSTTENVYWDAVSYSRHRLVQPTTAEFRLGSGAANNVSAALALITANGDPVKSYDVELADLAVADPVTYGDDRPLLGATCYVTSERIPETRTALRIVEMRRTSDRPASPTVRLTQVSRHFTAVLAGMN